MGDMIETAVYILLMKPKVRILNLTNFKSSNNRYVCICIETNNSKKERNQTYSHTHTRTTYTYREIENIFLITEFNI